MFDTAVYIANMDIHSFSLVKDENHERLSAICGGFEVWYEFPSGADLQLRADPFVSASLIVAMSLGEDIHLPDDIPVSPQLLDNLQSLQSIFHSWGPHWGLSLNPVEIRGGKKEEASGNSQTVSFFSGGVDGCYTYYKARKEIDLLLFVKGIDMQLSSDDLFQEAYQANKTFLAQQGDQLTALRSNVRFLGYHHNLGWNTWNGAGLASIAQAGGYQKCLIASGLSYVEMIPEGSSYLTDHLFSTEHTEIAHHGAESNRLEKIRFLAEQPGAMDLIRVCWQDKTYNCGQCPKCLRTMAAIRALKLDCPTFPELDTAGLKLMKSQKLYDPADVSFLKQVRDEAILQGDSKLAKTIGQCMISFELRKLGRHLDQLLLAGMMSKTKGKLRKQ